MFISWKHWHPMMEAEQGSKGPPPSDPAPETPDTPTPDTPAPETPPPMPDDPTPAQLETRLDKLEGMLQTLLDRGQDTEAVTDALEETQEAILETPASTGDDLDPATTDPGQESDPARSGDPTESSSPAAADAPGEPATGRKRKRAFNRRKGPRD